MGISIYPIHMGLDSVYAIRGDGVILIDGGDPHRLASLRKRIGKAGRSCRAWAQRPSIRHMANPSRRS